MVQKCCLFLMNWNTSNFLGFDFWLQGTHIDASGPFSSKLRTLTQTEGLWTFSSNLALCVPPHCATPIVFNFFYPIKLRLTLRPSPSLPSSCLLTTQKKVCHLSHLSPTEHDIIWWSTVFHFRFYFFSSEFPEKIFMISKNVVRSAILCESTKLSLFFTS